MDRITYTFSGLSAFCSAHPALMGAACVIAAILCAVVAGVLIAAMCYGEPRHD